MKGLSSIPLVLLLCGSVWAEDLLSLKSDGSIPLYLSGIARASDGSYFAAADRGGVVYRATIGIDSVSGEITTNAFERLPGSRGTDLEGIATHGGIVWVADEASNRVFRLPDNQPLRLTGAGDTFSACARNRGWESLAATPDGTALWICNEEAAPPETNAVRLAKFVRSAAEDGLEWICEEMYAYRPDPVAGQPFRGMAMSGVSDLTVLADGTLLALEREFSLKGRFPSIRIRIYEIGFEGADDIRGSSGADRAQAVSKRLRFELPSVPVNFEGFCEGPVLADGRRTLILIADGDAPLPPALGVAALP